MLENKITFIWILYDWKLQKEAESAKKEGRKAGRKTRKALGKKLKC